MCPNCPEIQEAEKDWKAVMAAMASLEKQMLHLTRKGMVFTSSWVELIKSVSR